MAEISVQAATLTQALIRVPYLLTPVPDVAPVSPYSHMQTVEMGNRTALHVAAMRLIAQDRTAEQAASANPNTGWHFTDERQQRIYDYRPLAVRMLARNLMRLHNLERLDSFGNPLKNDIAASTEFVPFSEVAAASDFEPDWVAEHLARAGYFADASVNNATKRRLLKNRQYPVDAIDYLTAHPAPLWAQEGDRTRLQMAEELNVSHEVLSSLVANLKIKPVIRFFEGQVSRELEYLSNEVVENVKQAYKSIPPPSGSEKPLKRLLKEQYGGAQLQLCLDVITLADIPVKLRRVRGRIMRCMDDADVIQLRRIITALTTLLGGEQGTAEMAAELGVGTERILRYILPADVKEARMLHSPEGKRWRYAFPAPVAARIKTRANRPRLPPYLITEAGMVRRFAPRYQDSQVRRWIPGLTYDHSDQDTKIVLPRGPGNRPLTCRSWAGMLALEEYLRLPDDAVSIRWDDLPYERYDLDPEKIEYARWLQAQLVLPEQVDRTPVGEWIARMQAEQQAGGPRIETPDPATTVGLRGHQRVRPLKGLILPSQDLLDLVILPDPEPRSTVVAKIDPPLVPPPVEVPDRPKRKADWHVLEDIRTRSGCDAHAFTLLLSLAEPGKDEISSNGLARDSLVTRIDHLERNIGPPFKGWEAMRSLARMTLTDNDAVAVVAKEVEADLGRTFTQQEQRLGRADQGVAVYYSESVRRLILRKMRNR